MIKISLEEAERVPIDRDGRILFRAEKNELVHITLHPGESIPLHPNPVDVLFFVVEGTAQLNTDNEIIDLNSNDSIFIKQGTNRGLTNNTDKILRILVYKMK
jgi:mannose-6-phosphate isomerase-like protein (cupin superfamily)